MKKIVLGLVVVLGFIGCGNKYPKPYTHKDKIVLSPKIGEVNTVEIGQTMFAKTKISGKTIKVSGCVQAKNPKAPKGIIKTNGCVQIEDSNRKYKFTNDILRITKKGHNSLCYSWFCSVDTTHDGYLDSWWNAKDDENYVPLGEKTKYVIKEIYDDSSFKYESLFQGIVGNKLKVSYREFIDNMARPAFTQDIEYEISQNGSTTIGFKGLRIEVLEATNFNIKYRVAKDYD